MQLGFVGRYPLTGKAFEKDKPQKFYPSDPLWPEANTEANFHAS